MHKRLVNHCTLDFSIHPVGPLLVKAGKEGADPTKPDMEFVETYHAGGDRFIFPEVASREPFALMLSELFAP